jgi:hypothetical protein
MITRGVADMWDYLTWLRVLRLTVTPEQHRAMQILERRGLRFLVDFGTDNAISLVTP